MTTLTASEPKLPNRMLAVLAAIADVSAVSALIALFLRQDAFLVLAIVIVALGVVLLLNWSSPNYGVNSFS